MATGDPQIDKAAMAALIQQNLANPGSLDAATNTTSGSIPVPEGMALPDFDTIAAAEVASAPPAPAPVAGEGASGVAGSPSPQPAQQPAAPNPFDPALNEPGMRVLPDGTPFGDVAREEQPAPAPFDSSSPATPGSPAPADPAVDPTNPTGDPDLDIGRLYELALGHQPRPDEVVETIALASRVAGLDEQRQAWVNGIMSGQIDPAEVERQFAELQQRATAAPAPIPQQPAVDEYGDPIQPTVDPALAAQRAQIEQERAALEAQRAQIQQQQMKAIQTGVESAWSNFTAEHADWAPEELAALRMRVDASPVFGAELQAKGDAAAAMSATINYAALTHDHFRSKLLGDAATAPDPTGSELARANTAAALAGNGQGSGGGGGARGVVGPTPPPGAQRAALNQVSVPAGYSNPAPVYDPTTQQPVLPTASPLTNPAPEGQRAPDLTNRNTQALVMAEEIQRMISGRS